VGKGQDVMELHSLLMRQLSRLGLESDTLPIDLENWQTFIEKVSKAYTEADQERYLTERSMELSSHELLELNKKLETAQQIAKLGYWVYDRSSGKITLSKELYGLFGLKQGEALPSFEEFMQMVYVEERSVLRKLIEKAFSEKTDYEYEIRMQRPDGEYRWYYVYGRPILDEEKKLVLTGIAMDITNRKKAQEEVELLNQQLVVTARQVGMADVASTTLHNVGNVLNSASVSADLLQENLDQDHYKKLFSIVDMLKENLPSLSDYLTQDSKGKLIPQYLVSLAEYIQKDNKNFREEVGLLREQIQHIKAIIATQNTISRAEDLEEKVLLSKVIDSALQLSENSRKFENIEIKKEYREDFKIIVDKTKLLQVLVNLIQNAKESVTLNQNKTKKQVSIFIQKDIKNEKAKIIVEDNGVGILKENLTKIFSLGFSTKENGHGFGLHSSAIAAQEMGGTLLAESKGVGKGAIFTLELPYITEN
jgi:PAS domain S-box-containing protein